MPIVANISRLAALALAAAASFPAVAETHLCYWTGRASSSFADPANWSNAVMTASLGPSDDAVFHAYFHPRIDFDSSFVFNGCFAMGLGSEERPCVVQGADDACGFDNTAGGTRENAICLASNERGASRRDGWLCFARGAFTASRLVVGDSAGGYRGVLSLGDAALAGRVVLNIDSAPAGRPCYARLDNRSRHSALGAALGVGSASGGGFVVAAGSCAAFTNSTLSCAGDVEVLTNSTFLVCGSGMTCAGTVGVMHGCSFAASSGSAVSAARLWIGTAGGGEGEAKAVLSDCALEITDASGREDHRSPLVV